PAFGADGRRRDDGGVVVRLAQTGRRDGRRHGGPQHADAADVGDARGPRGMRDGRRRPRHRADTRAQGHAHAARGRGHGSGAVVTANETSAHETSAHGTGANGQVANGQVANGDPMAGGGTHPAYETRRVVTSAAAVVLEDNPSNMTLEGTNTWLLCGRDAATSVVVDPGYLDTEHLERVVEAAGDVELILLTHHHPDHRSEERRVG